MSKTPLVLQLQELASRNHTDVAELLRRTLMVATKLNLPALQEWANHELTGYGDEQPPEYRLVRAELKARNPYHGLIPFVIDDRNTMNQLCNVRLGSPIGSLIDLLNSRTERGYLFIPFPPEQKAYLMRMQDDYVQLEPVRTVGANQVAGIIDVVRTKILDWSLALESERILGEGMTFSREEKEKAQSSISIGSFQGVLGDVTHSTVHQELNMSVKQGDFASLRAYLLNAGLTDADADELEAAIAKDPTPRSSDKLGTNVSTWIGKMISKAASGAWEIGVRAAGGLLGNAIAAYYGIGG